MTSDSAKDKYKVKHIGDTIMTSDSTKYKYKYKHNTKTNKKTM